MTSNQKVVAKATFDAIREQIDKLNWIDMLKLKQAWEQKLEYEQMPDSIKKMFLEVGLAGLKALNQASNGG